MDLQGAPRWELGVAAFFVLACSVVLWETRSIPPGTFEPLGSAPVPQATAIFIMLLSIAVGVRAVRRLSTVSDLSEPLDYQPRPLDALAVALITIVYVLLLDARLLDFAPLTAIFLFIVISLLARFGFKAMVGAAVAGAVTGWGAQYIFTRVFVVDLPGL
ncbi:MAG: tripartite tricarboxylate transporter TctB family protein [Pseudomonadota bacterium]